MKSSEEIRANAALDTLLVKPKRAHKHVIDLNAALDAFFAEDPYGVRREDDLDAQQCTYRVSKITDIPLPISGIVGDVLQNLRNALDHLAHHLVIKNRKTPTIHTCFPIADNATKYGSSNFRRKVKGLSKMAVKSINALHPYKTGNDVLWRLHALSIRDKHRALIPIATKHLSHTTMAMGRDGASESWIPLATFAAPRGPTVPLKIGDILLTIPMSEVQDQMQFRLDVVFNEPGVLEGEPIVEALHEMVTLVVSVITDFSTKKLL